MSTSPSPYADATMVTTRFSKPRDLTVLCRGTHNALYMQRQPNRWDRLLQREQQTWNAIQANGGIRAVVSPFRPKLLSVGEWGEPWMRATGEAQPLYENAVIPLPALGGGDALVLAFTVPPGYDGVITGITHFYTGQNFDEASGDLTWRLQVNRHWVKSMGAMITTMGSVQQPSPLLPGGIRVLSRDIVQYWVNVSLGAKVVGGNIFCAVAGRIYPEQW